MDDKLVAKLMDKYKMSEAQAKQTAEIMRDQELYNHVATERMRAAIGDAQGQAMTGKAMSDKERQAMGGAMAAPVAPPDMSPGAMNARLIAYSNPGRPELAYNPSAQYAPNGVDMSPAAMQHKMGAYGMQGMPATKEDMARLYQQYLAAYQQAFPGQGLK